ncbi:MAG: hypothetical protein H7245_01675 [Candidatus Saccharibacteria bacterium]|nr:hypothetical protein [Pseudorhodobacter sp.]
MRGHLGQHIGRQGVQFGAIVQPHFATRIVHQQVKLGHGGNSIAATANSGSGITLVACNPWSVARTTQRSLTYSTSCPCARAC